MKKDREIGAKRVLIASGGTGGHFYPGLALADELRSRGGWEPLFLVRKEDISIGALQRAYYPYAEIDSVSLPRGLSPAAYASFLAKLSSSFLACARIISDFGPDFVFGTGSYVSFPAVAAAAMKGVPSMIHDSNAVPGLANRLSGRFATVVALGLPVKPGLFPGKTVLTGTPIRGTFSAGHDVSQARRHFALAPDVPAVLVFGGSQGSRTINRTMAETAAKLKKEGAGFQLLHVTGKRDHAEILERYKAEGLDSSSGVKVMDYCSEMPLAYAAADIVVARSGGGTVSELSRLKKPSILVPLPGSPGNHQKANADVLAAAGAAAVIEESPRFGLLFHETLKGLLEAPDRLETMRNGFSKLDLPDPLLAAAALRDIIESRIKVTSKHRRRLWI